MLSPNRLLKIRIVAILVLVLLLALVIWQNSAPTRVTFVIFTADLPLMVWLALFLVIGIVTGIALARSLRRRT